MAKVRRLRVLSLDRVQPGSTVQLSPEEAKHARVLRLKPGTAVELFDARGRTARATLIEAGEFASARVGAVSGTARPAAWLKLAVAWPKGKRTAFLVEKCTEVGADQIIPVHYARSVVSKGDESEGLARLRRIAGEAAKQCGRSDIPEIMPERELAEVLATDAAAAHALALDPTATQWLPEVLRTRGAELLERPLLLFIGPEGGFAPEEMAAFDQARVARVRIARHILRIETAAVVACTIARSVADTTKT